MKNKNDLKDYCLKYKRYYGIDFDENFVVHHIDENRNNNDISNLLLLPTDVHSKYHNYKMAFFRVVQEGILLESSYSERSKLQMQLGFLNDLDDVLREVQQWKEYKRQANRGYNVYPMLRRLDYGNNKSK